MILKKIYNDNKTNGKFFKLWKRKLYFIKITKKSLLLHYSSYLNLITIENNFNSPKIVDLLHTMITNLFNCIILNWYWFFRNNALYYYIAMTL